MFSTTFFFTFLEWRDRDSGSWSPHIKPWWSTSCIGEGWSSQRYTHAHTQWFLYCTNYMFYLL